MIELNIDFKVHLKKYILKHKLFKANHNSIYTLDRILRVIEYVLKTGSSWRTLDLEIFDPDLKWQSIYYHFDKFSKAKVFENVYLEILNEYFKKRRCEKLKYVSVDASMVKNYYASNVGFNGHYKKKKWSKLSLFVDSNGVPISALLVPGNHSDKSLFFRNMKRLKVNINAIKTTNNRCKRYFLADAAYDSQDVRDAIKKKNINPIIWYVKRKRKQPELNKKLDKRETLIYKKRMIVENCFSWLYKNKRLNGRYDKYNRNYYSFMYMGFLRILLKRM